MGRARRLILLGGIAAAALALPAGAAAQSPSYPGIPWSGLLPPVASPGTPPPATVPHCRNPGMRCVHAEVRRLRALRNRLGCDHRAVFATTYMTLTQEIGKLLRDKPNIVRWRRYLFIEDALFANFYFRVLRAWEAGEPVPEAWRIAFETAGAGDRFGAQDMLLGINAHVQNDMPFVIAALGVRTANGDSRKPDHDAMNEALRRGYQPVIDAVRKRYDPSLDLTNPEQAPIDDAAGLEMVRGWRELVWRNAERLVNAKSDAERAQIAQQIEANAAADATLIAAPPAPGYGATRDAYCADRVG